MDGFVVSTTTMSLLALTSFCFLSQSTVTLASINTTQKRSCFLLVNKPGWAPVKLPQTGLKQTIDTL